MFSSIPCSINRKSPGQQEQGGWGSFLADEQTWEGFGEQTPALRGFCSGSLTALISQRPFWEPDLEDMARFPLNKKWISPASGGEQSDSSCSGNVLVLWSCRHKSRSFPGRNSAHLTRSLAKNAIKKMGQFVLFLQETPPRSLCHRTLGRFCLILLLHLALTSRILNLSFFLLLFYWWIFCSHLEFVWHPDTAN